MITGHVAADSTLYSTGRRGRCRAEHAHHLHHPVRGGTRAPAPRLAPDRFEPWGRRCRLRRSRVLISRTPSRKLYAAEPHTGGGKAVQGAQNLGVLPGLLTAPGAVAGTLSMARARRLFLTLRPSVYWTFWRKLRLSGLLYTFAQRISSRSAPRIPRPLAAHELSIPRRSDLPRQRFEPSGVFIKRLRAALALDGGRQVQSYAIRNKPCLAPARRPRRGLRRPCSQRPRETRSRPRRDQGFPRPGGTPRGGHRTLIPAMRNTRQLMQVNDTDIKRGTIRNFRSCL